ncbi:hypothetical protein U5801_23145 [Lamprobacter modestohalophilus]|uniref:hypothetical protein n=1 Tax=Lamprobacter modestohalophilus TaxID=1064514 RepID=UPI002ADEC054|nr:hypothetical protein [Lamprobacter modestohalophilus]MEA1052683.1 hypothetical protein [Lamprobacter modestohalophilus]
MPRSERLGRGAGCPNWARPDLWEPRVSNHPWRPGEELLAQETNDSQNQPTEEKFRYSLLNAFSFLKIAEHFFNGFDFEPHKVDGFTQEIISLKPDISRGKFNFYLRENISKAKRYQTHFEETNPSDRLNPYTMIRHCLYAGDKEIFSNILTNDAKDSFEAWLKNNG